MGRGSAVVMPAPRRLRLNEPRLPIPFRPCPAKGGDCCPYTRLQERRCMLESITPFFIVDNLAATLGFYQSKLGFAVLHKGGGDQPTEDFWAIVLRDHVMIML